MPGSDRHRRRPVGIFRAARCGHRGVVDPSLRGGAHRRSDVLRANDRERAEPPAHRRAARGIHGLLRPSESGCHIRTREELAMSKIEIGKKAPTFSLDGTDGKWSMKDAPGPVVLYFYPRD